MRTSGEVVSGNVRGRIKLGEEIHEAGREVLILLWELELCIDWKKIFRKDSLLCEMG